MKWRGNFYKDCFRAFLGGFGEGFSKAIREDRETWVLLAIGFIGMAVIIYFGR